jgi:23S rRNA (uracil1939-C5)-methyltransferase
MRATRRLVIESIAAGGDGVARADGLAVFVPRTAPGDVVDVNIRMRRRLGRGELVHVVQAGPHRLAPRCGHYAGDRCGGCQLQHLSYEGQLEAKRRIVRDAFARIARRDVPLPPIRPSPSPWAYRSKLTLAIRREGATWTIGLHAFDDPAHVFALRECPITDSAVVAAWQQIVAAAPALPPARELRGAVRRLGDDLALLLEGGTNWDAARDFARRCPSLHAIRWHPEGRPPVSVTDRRTGSRPAASFEQVNPPVASALRDALVERAMTVSPRSAIDAYAGTGATAAALVARGVRVTAIEVDAEAAAFAAACLPDEGTVLAARVEDAIAGVLPADVVVLNPPRAGLDARVIEALRRAPRPRAILYASCDPATLARDVGRLPEYGIRALQAFDMFPQTAHVETLCELTPEDA